MSTQRNHQITSQPAPANFDLDVASVVRMLMARSRMSVEQLGAVVGISRGTLYNRLKAENPWQAWELKVIAEHFGESPTIFFENPETLFRSKCFSPAPQVTGADEATLPALRLVTSR